MGVSLKDIALTLKLSTTTVSWVLAGKGDEKNISRPTQKRILECSRKMGYQPNLIARSLNLGVSKTLGLILPSINDRFYSQIAEEIELEAEKFGYTLMFCSSGSELDRETRMIDMLRAKQVDGIILAPTKLSPLSVQAMLDDDFPFVLFDRYFADIDTNYVVMDNEECSYKLIDHLLDKGARNIAAITTNPHLLILQQRYQGYCRAYREHGLEPDPGLKWTALFANFENNTVAVMDEIFRTRPDVDAFFFISHILAVEALIYMTQRGIDPGRFQMACIHEVSAFRALAPKINTARIPVEAMGRETVHILLDNIRSKVDKNGPAFVKRATMIPTTLTFRD